MTKCENFLNYFDELIEACHVKQEEIPEDVKEFYDMLKSSQSNFSNGSTFTEIGLTILEYLQKIEEKTVKAKDIAEGLLQPSRKISGAMRKLTVDGYVEKFGQNPVIYALTEKGKKLNIKEYKEK